MKALLAYSFFYRHFTRFVTADGRSTREFVSSHIRAHENDHILDIACGPGDLRAFLPEKAVYTGFDISEKYIESARNKYNDRGKFFVAAISPELVGRFDKVDVVIACGVLHHLNDAEAGHLFAIAQSALKPGGRLITADGCYHPKQSWLARKIVSMDRGEYVRHADDYVKIARQYFGAVEPRIYDGWLRIPYSHIVMECGL